MQSFTKQVKEEIIKNEFKKPCCQKTLFAALVFLNNRGRAVKAFSGNMVFSSSSAPLARLILKLAKKFSKQKSIWGFKEDKKRKSYRYIVYLPSEISRKGGSRTAPTAQKSLLSILKQSQNKRCCARALITGLFLNCGAINPPNKAYHLEFIINNPSARRIAPLMMKLFKAEQLTPKYYKKEKIYSIYLKKADDIADFFNIIKAHKTLLKFEDVRAFKETKNEVQRRVNCEVANLDKIMDASFRQLKALEIINEKTGLFKLPRNLLEVAVLRLSNPEKSSQELAFLTDPQITRLAVSRKLKRIEEIAERIKNKIKRRELCQ